jgi:hypothetical protein
MILDWNFNTLLERLKERGYYIIRTDDWDRYYWEVYANDEMVFIASHENEAYMKLWEFVQNDLSDN